MYVCKSRVWRCVLSMGAALPVMLLTAVVTNHFFGHTTPVPLPGVDLDLGLLGIWGTSVVVGDGVRRVVQKRLRS